MGRLVPSGDIQVWSGLSLVSLQVLWSVIYILNMLLHKVFDSFLLGGSLQDALLENAKRGQYFLEAELKEILLQVSMGLKYIHNSGLVHLDIKPSKCTPLPLPCECCWLDALQCFEGKSILP